MLERISLPALACLLLIAPAAGAQQPAVAAADPAPAAVASAPDTAPPAPTFPSWQDLPPLHVGPHVFHRRLLANGLHALAVRDLGDDVSVFMVIGSGRRQETSATSGLAHLVEHAMYAGSKDVAPGEHDRRIVAMGGESNAFTRDDYTLFYDHHIPAGKLSEVLRLEAERLRGLTFDEAPFLHERSRLADEEARTFSPAAARDELIEAAVFLAHPYGVGLLDEEGHTLAPRLSAEIARAFYEHHYRPERTAVVVAGNIDPAIALDAVTVAFGALRGGPQPPPIPAEPMTPRGGRLSFVSKLERPLVEHVWVVPPLGHPDRPALAVLARLLGHATLSDGRTVRASVGDRFDNELFRVSAGGALADRELESLTQRAQTDLFDAKQVAATKALLRDDFIALALRGRPYFALAAIVGIHCVLGLPTLPGGWHDAIESVDPEGVRRVAQLYLAPERRFAISFEATGAPAAPLPTDAAGLLRVAQDAESTGDLDRAIDAFSALLKLEPSRMNEVIYLASRGQISMKKHDYAAAIADFEEALAVVDYPAVRDLLEEARRLELQPGAPK
jgi:predicted Zn-dependent peptidase